MPRTILLLHSALSPASLAADQDVLVQAEVVEAALRRLEWNVVRFPCTLNLQALLDELERVRPTAVFNLAESIGGSDGLAHLVADVLEYCGIPFTGSGSQALRLSNDKLLTKDVLGPRLAPVLIPDFVRTGDEIPPDRNVRDTPRQYILKAIREHASVGIDDSSVVVARRAELPAIVARHSAKLGRPCFAEEFIAGREFNLSLLADNGRVTVLPPAEIDFSTFPVGKPRIVGYDAKWAERSFEFDNTPRRFDLPESDAPLVATLARAAAQCWGIFDLRGYARVDFRVDDDCRAFCLEVNTNPCLSPDGGFAAALAAAGIDFTTAVERILRDAQAGEYSADKGVGRVP